MQVQRIGPALIPIGSTQLYLLYLDLDTLPARFKCQTPIQTNPCLCESMSCQIQAPATAPETPVLCLAMPPPPGPEWPTQLEKEANCNRPGRAASLGSPCV